MFGCSARTARVLRCGASTLVLGAALLQVNPALAQTAPTAQDVQDQQEDQATPLSQSTNTEKTSPPSAPEKNAIIITGTRGALRTSQQIKRNADTVVDSITATDIGAFPDKSVADALQRIPGITVNRFAATSDTAHFSAEPSGVIIRGLPQVRSEFNGRDTFSANSSRGLSWTDITPELLQGVDVYKNQTADMIEGGIAGTVDLRTRVPFDAKGQLIQVGARANYGDLDKKWTPDINGYYSNRWQTGGGEFGIMGNIAYSQVKTRSQGIQYGRTAIVENGAPGWPALTFFPASINFLDNEYDRKRYGIAGAGQWKSNSGKVLVTAQYLRSLYKNAWQERSFGDFGLGPDLYCPNVRARVVGPMAGPDEQRHLLFPRPERRLHVRFGRQFPGRHRQPQGCVSAGGATPAHEPASASTTRASRCSTPATAWATSPECQYQANGIGGLRSGSRHRQPYQPEPQHDPGRGAECQMGSDRRPALQLRRTVCQFEGRQLRHLDRDALVRERRDSTRAATSRASPISDPTNINQSEGGLANPNNWYLRSVMDHLEGSQGPRARAARRRRI